MLLAFVLFAPIVPAHAHGIGVSNHGAVVSHQTTVDQSPAQRGPGKCSDKGSSCCLFSQCAQTADIVSPDATVTYGGQLTTPSAYAPRSVLVIDSLRSGPATPPPRLDA
jgi:hypothetical protein